MKKALLFLSFVSFSILSNAQNCLAGFTSVDQGGGTFQFFDTSYVPAGSSAAFWVWSFGDGGTSTQQNPTHTYTTDGIKNVTLNITTSTFCNNTANGTVNVTGTSGGNACDASFTAMDLGTGMGDFSFTPNTPNANPLASHHWDFGDGSTDSVLLTIHTFLNTGTYNVCYIVTDPIQGCADTTCQMIPVIAMNVNKITNSTTNVYPSVFDNSITIEFIQSANAMQTVTLVDVLGNTVLSETFSANTHQTLNTDNITSGVYFIRIQNGKEVAAFKMMKN